MDHIKQMIEFLKGVSDMTPEEVVALSTGKKAEKIEEKKVKKKKPDKPGTRPVPRTKAPRYGPRYGVKVMNFQAVEARPRELPGSLWVTGPEIVVDLDPDEIEGLFRKPQKKKKRPWRRGPAKPKKPEPVSVADESADRALRAGRGVHGGWHAPHVLRRGQG